MSKQISLKQVTLFRKKLWDFYRKHKREFPWRKTKDPYKILVSEIMLQQTQAQRVVGKYESFIKSFPNFSRLSAARLGDVLKEWQGLGYNRRAKMLWQLAKVVTEKYHSKLPSNDEALLRLPGIGKATAAAIQAFGFNKPSIYLETNVRTVYIHEFFSDEASVHDSEIISLIEQTQDTKSPREWHSAVLDYGAHIKSTIGNKNIQSKHYVRQSQFQGSFRQARGMVLKVLTEGPKSKQRIVVTVPFNEDIVRRALEKLLQEGLIVRKRNFFRIP